MIAKELKMDGDKILGADDFVASYSTDNADAFVKEEPKTDPAPSKPLPTFVQPTGAPAPQPQEKGEGFGFHFMGVRPKPEDK